MRRAARWALPLFIPLMGAWTGWGACTNPTITITSNPASPSAGQAFAITATFSGLPLATGFVQFKNGIANLGALQAFTGGVATLNLSGSALAAGTYTISLNYISNVPATWCSLNVPNTPTYTLVITPAGATTTSLTASPTSFPPNVTTTLTATVSASASATGTMTFTLDGTTTLASGVVYTLVGGVPNWIYTIPMNTLTVGAHSVTATYSGDTNGNLTSTSSAVALSVAQVATTTTISTSAATITRNQTDTLTATVTPTYVGDVPTGTVSFILDNTTTLATVSPTLVGGSPQWKYTIPINTLSLGAHNVKAQFNGDTSNLTSVSSNSGISVVQSATTTTVAVGTGTIAPNMADTFTATVTPAFTETPTGTVTFLFNGSAVTGSSNKTLSCATTCTAVFNAPVNTFVLGAYSVTAVYSGDANNLTSTSSAASLSVTKATTTTTVTSSAPSFQPNQTDTLTATVTPNLAESPGGTVTFLFNGSAIAGSSNIAVSCAATCTSAFTVPTNGLPVGPYMVTAQYSGDGNNSSSSGTTSVTVSNLPASTTTVSASATNIAPNQTDTFTATVTPAGVTGTVTFLFNGSAMTGSSNIALTCGTSCTATFTSPANSLAVNTYSVTAHYSGDSNYQASTSSAVTVTVAKMSTTTTLSASPVNIAPNQTTTLNATISPALAGTNLTGTVTFLFNGSAITGSSNVAVTCGTSCTSTFTVPASTLAVGTYSLTAQYGGDTNTLSSTSSPVTLTVGKMSTTTTLSGTPTSFAPVQASTFTATITPQIAGTVLTGTVNFLFNGTAVTGSSNMAVTCGATCAATFSAPAGTLAVNTYSVTAVFSGDANTLPSTSSPVSITVAKMTTTTTVTQTRANIVPSETDTVTVTVAPAIAGTALTGTVTLRFNGAPITGSSNLTVTCGATCTATFTVPGNTFTAGNYSITAQYNGDANTLASLSSPINLAVSSTTTTLTATLTSIAPNQGNTFTATVTPRAGGTGITGTVTFLFNGAPITGSSNVTVTCAATCTAVFTMPGNILTSGTYSVTGQYSGDASNQPSTSVPLSLTVGTVAIPDLSVWGIGITALLLLAAGLAMTRRRVFTS